MAVIKPTKIAESCVLFFYLEAKDIDFFGYILKLRICICVFNMPCQLVFLKILGIIFGKNICMEKLIPYYSIILSFAVTYFPLLFQKTCW